MALRPSPAMDITFDPFDKPAMLVVDDEHVIASALASYFRNKGFAVDKATAIDEATGLLAERSYDIVIADVRLSGSGTEEGLEVVRRARAMQSGFMLSGASRRVW